MIRTPIEKIPILNQNISKCTEGYNRDSQHCLTYWSFRWCRDAFNRTERRRVSRASTVIASNGHRRRECAGSSRGSEPARETQRLHRRHIHGGSHRNGCEWLRRPECWGDRNKKIQRRRGSERLMEMIKMLIFYSDGEWNNEKMVFIYNRLRVAVPCD